MFNSKKLFATEAVVDNLLRVESYHILHCPTAIECDRRLQRKGRAETKKVERDQF